MSKIKVNEIENRTGSTLTLGKSGTTIQLACGATQTGFGRTGTVNWCTTAKTSPFTATSGSGFFINTSSGSVTVTLPASPSAGDIIAVSDYANTFDSNKLNICRNSSKINGSCFNAELTTAGIAATLVYVDGTRGWKQVNDATANVSGTPAFIAATGGTITTSGDFKIHTFTGSGTFSICSAPTPANNTVDYLVVGGGGGGGQGGSRSGGGGGGGGFRFRADPSANPQSGNPGSPLNGPAGIPVAAGNSFPITVGSGGTGGEGPGPNAQGTAGTVSTFSTITSAGGGFGGGESNASAGPGASGGGAGGGNCGPFCGGSGNVPPVSPAQGTDGGDGTPGAPGAPDGGGAGGGAIGAGQNHQPGKVANGGDGGGVTGFGAGNGQCISCVQYFSGGGGGVGQPYSGGAVPASGGDGGGGFITASGTGGTAGTVNTGGGGGGSRSGGPTGANAGNGGSGIVVIRYKFQ